MFDLLVSTSAAAGPFLGGLIVAAFGWRAMFLLAAPIALVAAAVGVVLLEPPGAARRPAGASLDIGPRVFGAAIGAFLARRAGGAARAARVVRGDGRLLVAFVAWELRRRTRQSIPDSSPGGRSLRRQLGVFGMTVVLHGCFVVVPLLVQRYSARRRPRAAPCSSASPG